MLVSALDASVVFRACGREDEEIDFVKIDLIIHRVVNGIDNATSHVMAPCLALMNRVQK